MLLIHSIISDTQVAVTREADSCTPDPQEIDASIKAKEAECDAASARRDELLKVCGRCSMTLDSFFPSMLGISRRVNSK
jgi:hypothetical protein